jgi:hypothetical protein
MVVVMKVMTFTPVNPSITLEQIHIYLEEVFIIRLTGTTIYFSGDSLAGGRTATVKNYVLGTVSTMELLAQNGVITAYCNSALKFTYIFTGTGNYLNVGNHLRTTSPPDLPSDRDRRGRR